jgi:hypothetical protein
MRSWISKEMLLQLPSEDANILGLIMNGICVVVSFDEQLEPHYSDKMPILLLKVTYMHVHKRTHAHTHTE